jgi:YrbI family 3-deoxy-D-manno-octulosonate 8-phosphate phosphatase
MTSIGGEVDLVVLDFDGVLTDNAVWVLEDGTEMVRCDRSDGLGIAMLKKAGIPVMVLSTETNPVVTARCEKLAIPCVQGVSDKGRELVAILARERIDSTRVAYVGNDVNDLDCMEIAGFPVAVADAHPQVLGTARVVLSTRGGYGAVRELCDLLLSKRLLPRSA